ncbi:MAG: rhodanese-like domain-containing protein [Gammaproteobacteria bacterium]|jgi:rhodanese-related sulfurtransferase|nr:rhodanese-like domain-containing protein [Gammaproteobacteria bacterium]|tara:strand:- start:98 stop:415 length:318 start_codon:yes stop_codon:yes gene_type:complete
MIEMTALELNEYITKNSNIVLIDVRESWEYSVVSIKDSIHIPISEIQNRMHDFKEDQTIVFICHHGIRSRMVGNYFQQNDFENIINLRGGIDSWAKTVDNKMAVY